MRAFVMLVVMTGVAGVGAPAMAQDGPGLRVVEGELLLAGEPFRGIGVNYFDAFYRVLMDADDTSYDEGFATLAAMDIPFVRFMAAGFWPVHMRLYVDDREEYFRRLDAVVASAEAHGIGLIPSLFWHHACVPDLVGEPVSAWGDADSETRAFMARYTRDVVERYRDSPAIWAWEFGNEYNLPADLPNAERMRPQVQPSLGTPAHRSEADDLTQAMVRSAKRAFARVVREIDGERMISSGDAGPRRYAWHNKVEGTWDADSPAQSAAMWAADNPDPIDTLTARDYAHHSDKPGWTIALDAGRALDKPVFVGEFGMRGEAFTNEQRQQFHEMLARIEREVVIAALWVYDFDHQDGEWNITADNARAWQLEAVAEANARLRGEAE
ncbi:MAG: cellulase family glycosylhydrolase [Phycisphaeraceae bacterium]